MEKLRLGDGLEDSTDVGPVVNRAALEKIHSYTEIGKDEGATLPTGGEVATENGLDRGSYYCTCTRRRGAGDADCAGGDLRADDRTDPCDRISTRRSRSPTGSSSGLVLDLHQRREQGLPRHARPQRRDHVHQRGHDRRRGPPPFGGTKGTGNGHREAGQAALDFYTEWKSIYVDYSGKLQRAQID